MDSDVKEALKKLIGIKYLPMSITYETTEGEILDPEDVAELRRILADAFIGDYLERS